MHITRNRPLGKFVLRCLEKTNKPLFIKNGITLYIKVSENNRVNDKKIVEARYTSVILSQSSINDIIEVFDSFFRAALIAYVNGAEFGNDYKKGKRNKAIYSFLEKYNMNCGKSSFEKIVKMYYREKQAETNAKVLINRLL